MHVAELTAAHVRVPLKKAIKHASYARTSTDNGVVKCVLADGSTGYRRVACPSVNSAASL